MHSLAYIPAEATLEAELRHFCASAQVDTPLLPERRLAERYGLTHAAVRKVLKRLHDDGVIHRHQGRGTFVAPREAELNVQTIIYVDTWHQMAHPYYASRLRGIMAEARQLRFRIQAFDGPPVESAALYADAAQDGVGGVVLPYATAELEARLRLANPRLAIVSTGYPTAETTITHVAIDYRSLGAMAAAYLLRHGTRRPFLVSGHREAGVAFAATCAEAGVEGITVSVTPKSPEAEAVVARFQEALPDGLAYDDERVAAAINPRLGPCPGPVIAQLTQGATPPIAQAAMLEVDGLTMGRLTIRTLHTMIHHGLYHNAIVRVRPKLIEAGGWRRPSTDNEDISP